VTKAQKKQAQKWLWFFAYVLLMLWLLFGQRMEGGQLDISLRGDRNKINLIPFETVRLYWRVLQKGASAGLLIHSVINLAGNVVMFVPLGWFLPNLWKAFRGFFRTVIFGASLICLVELLQYMTGLGSCDIDDLILNTAGIILGYCFCAVKRKK
jgi:glycopeptide antibiotics resistance protein